MIDWFLDSLGAWAMRTADLLEAVFVRPVRLVESWAGRAYWRRQRR